MMKVKELMVETLVTVTSEEIRAVAEEVYKREKIKAKQGRYPWDIINPNTSLQDKEAHFLILSCFFLFSFPFLFLFIEFIFIHKDIDVSCRLDGTTSFVYFNGDFYAFEILFT